MLPSLLPGLDAAICRVAGSRLAFDRSITGAMSGLVHMYYFMFSMLGGELNQHQS